MIIVKLGLLFMVGVQNVAGQNFWNQFFQPQPFPYFYRNADLPPHLPEPVGVHTFGTSGVPSVRPHKELGRNEKWNRGSQLMPVGINWEDYFLYGQRIVSRFPLI